MKWESLDGFKGDRALKQLFEKKLNDNAERRVKQLDEELLAGLPRINFDVDLSGHVPEVMQKYAL
jgi:hypothetical protein